MKEKYSVLYKIIQFFYTNFPKQYGQVQYLKARLFLVPKILLLKINFLNFFGSKGQDKWVVEEIFNYKKNGFFLDLAATDGLLESNTYVLEYYFGWKGIAIEPNRNFFNKLKKNRKCTCINAVVSGSGKSVDFIEDGPTGGIIGDKFDNNFRLRSEYLKKNKKKIISKKTLKLEDILKKNKAPKIIDYFSLDVEGSETEILENFCFKKYIFLSLTIERPTPKLNSILIDNNYVFVKNFKVDTFYVHKSIGNFNKIKKNIFFQLPPKTW